MQDQLTCPTCGKSFDWYRVFVFNEGDFPDLCEPTLFPEDVLEFPCGHSQVLTPPSIPAPLLAE